MTLSFLPEIPKIDPEKGPNLIAGAASPLWLMFGGAAAAGATWWWWSARWREAVNVEALMATALTPALAEIPLTHEPAPEPVELAPEPVIDPVTEAPVLAPVELEPAEPVIAAATAATEVVAEAVQETLDTAEAVLAETVETVEIAAEPVVEAVVEQTKAAGDDLTLLVGIGPKLATSLAELGVTRFSEIAAWGPEELADFDVKLALKGRAERDAWVAQAKRLAAGS
jgi:predicted flap endonuclease-1-like 5' DNA nuclease